MDKNQGARSGHGASGPATDVPSEQLTATVIDPTRARGSAAWRRRAGNGADPEPTEEIGDGNETPATSARRKPVPSHARAHTRAHTRTHSQAHTQAHTRSRAAAELPRQQTRSEPTDPVGPGPEDTVLTPGRLPAFSKLLRRSRPLPAIGTDPAPVGAPGVLARDTVLAGRYVILERVGDSGMSFVYKALDQQRERAGSPEPWVALKVARPASSDRAETQGNLRREFLKLSRLRHPNIVAVYDFGSEDGVEFMVLEWLEGETLAARLERLSSKRMALASAEEVIRSIAAALAHAHAAGIVHGDVKPSNVFVMRDTSVKLLDFGASGHSTPDKESDERGWATRAYASCDVLRGQAPQPADDVFALGVTAYRLLSGERPFGDLDALTAKERGLAPPELPADAFASRAAVRNALQLEAVDRPFNAGEFLRQLADEPDDAAASVFPRPVPAHLTAIAWGGLAAFVLGVSVWSSLPETPATLPAVERLLDDAADAMAAGRVAEPPENNAAQLYSEVLESDPGNVRAIDGLDRIAERFLTSARDALGEENYEEAVASLDRARQLRPEHFGIAPVEDLIGRYRRDLLVSAQQAAETDLELAERYLAQAAALSSTDDPDIAAAREGLQRERTDRQVTSLVRAIDERILSERLLVPSGDSAIDLLRRATRLARGDRQVQLARDRIASALLFQAMFSISGGNLDDAEAFIRAARSLEVPHLALARADYELARARRQAAAGDSGTDPAY